MILLNSFLLFRKRAALDDDGLSWLKGGDTFTGPEYSARRNATGRVGVGYLIVRALLAAARGKVREAGACTGGIVAQVSSRSEPGKTNTCWSNQDTATYSIPNGAENNATYHLPLLWMLEALSRGPDAEDFWAAYAALLETCQSHGTTEAIKPALVKVADELYFWGAPS